jgi:hypothetical protein
LQQAGQRGDIERRHRQFAQRLAEMRALRGREAARDGRDRIAAADKVRGDERADQPGGAENQDALLHDHQSAGLAITGVIRPRSPAA